MSPRSPTAAIDKGAPTTAVEPVGSAPRSAPTRRSSDPEAVAQRYRRARELLEDAHYYDPHDVEGGAFFAPPVAIELLAEIATYHRTAPVGGRAIDILLDLYIRTGRIDELDAIVADLRADTAFLTANPELERYVQVLLVQKAGRDAEALARERDFIGCGERYVQLAKKHTQYPRIGELLYRAGVCFSKGRAPTRALAVLAALRERQPPSAYRMNALLLEGRLLASLTRYREAARRYEEYARRYAGERDAHDALHTGAIYRRAIGDHSRAIANLDRWIMISRRKFPHRGAADALLTIADIERDRGRPASEIKTLERYDELVGAKAGLERQVVALSRLGRLLWLRSCRRPAVDGTCTRTTRAGVRVRSRNRRLVQRSHEALTASIRAYAKLRPLDGDPWPDEDAMVWRQRAHEAFAASQFTLAEAEFERLIGPQTSPALDVATALARYNAWPTALRTIGRQADRVPNREITYHWVFAAALRRSQLARHFGDATRATAGLEHCVTKARRMGERSEWTTRCAAVLRQAKPGAVLQVREAHAAPYRAGPVLDLEPIIVLQ